MIQTPISQIPNKLQLAKATSGFGAWNLNHDLRSNVGLTGLISRRVLTAYSLQSVSRVNNCLEFGYVALFAFDTRSKLGFGDLT